MKNNPWLAALLNFFLMGLGYVYIGKKRPFGLGLTVGALALTYVELSLKGIDTKLYAIMFGAVFLVNTCFAIDGYQEALLAFGEEPRKPAKKRRIRAHKTS